MTTVDLSEHMGVITTLYGNGASARWLAKRYVCSQPTLLRRLHDAGVAVRPRGRAPRKVRA